jgi:hypothetical protein
VVGFGANGLNDLAWFRARNGDGNELCLQVIANGDSGAGATTVREKYSAAAGFTGGAPDFNTVPSASDEGVFRGGGTDAAPTGTNLYGGHDNANSTPRIILGIFEDVSPWRFACAEVTDDTPGHALGGWLYSTVRVPTGVTVPHNKLIYGAGHSGAGTLVPWSGEMTSASYGGTGTNGAAFGYVGAVSTGNFRELKAQVTQDHQDLNPSPFSSNARDLMPVIWAREDGQSDPDGIFGIDTMLRAVYTLETIFNHLYQVLNGDNVPREYLQLNWFAIPWHGAADPYVSFAAALSNAIIWEDAYSVESGSPIVIGAPAGLPEDIAGGFSLG